MTPAAISAGEVGSRGMLFDTLHPIVTKGLGISLSRFFGSIPKYKEPKVNRGGRPRKDGTPAGGARA